MTGRQRPANARSPNAQKYGADNPVVRWLIQQFLRDLARAIAATRPTHILDLGCGEGFVASALFDALPDVSYVGVDRSEEALRQARARHPHADFRLADFMEAPLPETRDQIVLCLEVLEHQAHPAAMVERLSTLPCRAAFMSVPWEPWFRCGNLLRGQHTDRLGSSPGHLQHFSPRTFSALLEQHYARVELMRPFPWLLAQLEPAGPTTGSSNLWPRAGR